MRNHYTNFTILDVYDEAALIRKDFERIIESKKIFFLFVFINFLIEFN